MVHFLERQRARAGSAMTSGTPANRTTTDPEPLQRSTQPSPMDQSGGVRTVDATRIRHGADSTVQRVFTVDRADWNDAKSIQKIGAGSANGVFMLRTKSESLVIKGASGAARNQMGSEMMQASGAHAVGMRTILLASPEGIQLLKVMTSLGKAADKKAPKGARDTAAAVARLAGGAYDSVTVMPAYSNLDNMLDLARSDQFAETFALMKKNGFFNGLGRIHAADMVMGNEDRLARGGGADPSLKNVFVNTWSGQAVGLDLDVNAHSFDQVTGDLRQGGERATGSNAPSLTANKVKDFVNFCVKGSMAKKEYLDKKGDTKSGPMSVRGGGMNVDSMELVADPAAIDKTFTTLVAALEDEVRRAGNDADADALAQANWTPSRAEFAAGVAHGIDELRKKMKQLSARSDQLSNTMGADAMFDPRVFKVRLLYVELRKLHDDPTSMMLLEHFANMLLVGEDTDDFWLWYHNVWLPSQQPTDVSQPEPDVDIGPPPNRPLPPTPGERGGLPPIRSTGGRARPRTKQGTAPPRPLPRINATTRATPRVRPGG